MYRFLASLALLPLLVGQRPPEGPSHPAALSEEAARAGISAHPQSADAWYALGYALFLREKPKPSLEAYTKGASLRTPTANDLLVVGCDYVLLRDYADADKWFTKAVEWDPANAGALYYLGRTKYNENRFEDAIAAFTKALQLDPKNVKAEDNRGLALDGLGKTAEAIDAFKLAISWQANLPTKNPGPYIDLGALYVDHGQPDVALPYLRTATEIAPGEVRAQRQLGKAYLHLEQWENARHALEKATEADAADATSHFLLAQAYRKLDLTDKAHAESERFKQLTR